MPRLETGRGSAPCHPPAGERRATPTRGSRNPSRTAVTATFALNGGERFPRFRSSVPAFTIMTEDTWHNRIGIIASLSNLGSTSGRTWPVGHGPRAGRMTERRASDEGRPGARRGRAVRRTRTGRGVAGRHPRPSARAGRGGPSGARGAGDHRRDRAAALDVNAPAQEQRPKPGPFPMRGARAAALETPRGKTAPGRKRCGAP